MRILPALLLIVSAQGADWIRVRSADIELLTDTSEKTARETLHRLAQMGSVLSYTPAPESPLRIYLFASQSEYKQYAPAPSASGFYHSGFDYATIVARMGPTLTREITHEFVHFVSHARGGTRWPWLEEGMAEFYSNAEFLRDGVRLGAPIREHVDLLNNQTWLTAEEMQVVRADAIFYAESWALYRMIRSSYSSYPNSLTDRDLGNLRSAVNNFKPFVSRLPPVQDAPVVVDRVGALDALLLRGELALRTGHLGPAREHYTRAERRDPNSARAVAGLAALAEAEGDRERAKALFERSLAMDDRDATAWFQYAVVTGDEGALRKAAELDPDLGEARLLLGVRATDDGDIEGALEHLKRATQLLPRKSYAWYSLAFAQNKAGEANAAHDSVERALQTATTAEQTAMAQALKGALGN